MPQMVRMQGEFKRLLGYGRALAAACSNGPLDMDAVMYSGEGVNGHEVITRQGVLERIAKHLAHMNNERIALGDERTVRRTSRHFYRMCLDSRVAKTLGV